MLRSIAPTLLASAALVVALIALLRSPEHAAPCACAPEVTRAEHDRLGQQVELVAAQVSRIEAVRSDATPAHPPTAAATADPVEAPASVEPVHYARFEAPRGIVVHADDNGAISVRNDDASMTGKMIVIRGQRDDGTTEPITILVPPPPR